MARCWFLLGLVKGAGLALLVFIVFGLLLFLKGPACWTCRASGGTRLLKCADCDGTGMTRQLSLSLCRTLSCGRGPSEPWRLVLRRDEVEVFSCTPALVLQCFWAGAGLLVAGALAAGLRASLCRGCGGRGCDSCGGKGRLTTIDRWVTRG